VSNTLVTVLVSASVGSLFSLAGLFVSSWLNEKSEKRRKLWERESERILKVEERAGIIVELCHSQPAGREASSELNGLLGQLHQDVGRLRRYPELSRAIRDVRHWSGCMLYDKLSHHEVTESSKELDAAFNRLRRSSDAALK